MQVLSITQSYFSSFYAHLLQKATEAGDTAAVSADGSDTLSLATESFTMPPPPHEVDFEAMSDSDLKSYLDAMYAITGIVPGTETAIGDLTEEELGKIRETLAAMSNSDPLQKMAESEDTSNLSGEDTKVLMLMFLMSLQANTSLFGDTLSGDIFFSGNDFNAIMQLMLENIMQKSQAEDEGIEQSQVEKAITAYEKNMVMV